LQSVNFIILKEVPMTVVEKPRVSKDNFIIDPLELWCKTKKFRDYKAKGKNGISYETITNIFDRVRDQ